MSTSEIITIIGTVLTALGTIITIIMAKKAKSYKEQVATDIRRIDLSEALNFLRRAQDNSRKLLNAISNNTRGINRSKIIDTIQEQIDKSLMCIDSKGPNKDLRTKILNAQEALDEVRNSKSNNLSDPVKKLHFRIQESISITRSESQNLIGE